MEMSYVAEFFSLMLFITMSLEDRPPEVRTKLGVIRGKQVTFHGVTVDEYLGVPFAEPPVGDLRFKKTVPLKSYRNPINATKMPPACLQYSTEPYPWYDDKSGQSEDCLYLNIWVPCNQKCKAEPKSVIYFIFGGGFYMGSIRKPIYNGEAMAVTGDVIVVTVNYRLGSLGFLTSGTEDAPGNVALYDVLEGLKWVHSNIGSFGGDQGSITIAGQSAGSIIVGILTVSPLSKGLYRRAIMQSGAPTYTAADNNTQNLVRSEQVAEALNCASSSYTIMDHPSEVVSCLRGVDATRLVRTTTLLSPNSPSLYIPQYGDELVPKNPRKAILNGDFHNSKILIGNTMDERSFYLTAVHPKLFGFFGKKNTLFNKTIARNFLEQSLSNSTQVFDFYLGSVPDSDLVKIRRQTYLAEGDFGLVCPDVYFAEAFSSKNNSVYFYYFVHRPSLTPWARWMGVVHYDDVAFSFGQPVINPSYYEDDETRLSLYVMRSFTNFAKTGSPGSDWPVYSKDDPKAMIFNTTKTNKYAVGPRLKYCNFFRPFIVDKQ